MSPPGSQAGPRWTAFLDKNYIPPPNWPLKVIRIDQETARTAPPPTRNYAHCLPPIYALEEETEKDQDHGSLSWVNHPKDSAHPTCRVHGGGVNPGVTRDFKKELSDQRYALGPQIWLGGGLVLNPKGSSWSQGEQRVGAHKQQRH